MEQYKLIDTWTEHDKFMSEHKLIGTVSGEALYFIDLIDCSLYKNIITHELCLWIERDDEQWIVMKINK